MNAIPAHIAAAIGDKLAAIEREHRVTVLWACESGSRAWGFPSPDSDFDARFIYVHDRDWYLSIAPGRDVIERPVDEVFDVSGWDLRKALGLIRGGNATPVEWLGSPWIYRKVPGFAEQLRTLIASTYQPQRSYMHYRSVSERHVATSQRGAEVHLKKWLYALRTCLAAEWSATRQHPPPMTLADLADALVTEPAKRQGIDELVAIKAGLAEKSGHTVGPELVEWLNVRVEHLAAFEVPRVEPPPVEPFDDLFGAWVTPASGQQ